MIQPCFRPDMHYPTLVGLHPEIHHADGVVRETGSNLAAFFVPAHFEYAPTTSVGLQDPAFFHRPDV